MERLGPLTTFKTAEGAEGHPVPILDDISVLAANAADSLYGRPNLFNPFMAGPKDSPKAAADKATALLIAEIDEIRNDEIDVATKAGEHLQTERSREGLLSDEPRGDGRVR